MPPEILAANRAWGVGKIEAPLRTGGTLVERVGHKQKGATVCFVMGGLAGSQGQNQPESRMSLVRISAPARKPLFR